MPLSHDGSARHRRRVLPGAWLARWLEEKRGYEPPLWAIAKTGVQRLRAALTHLVEQLSLDAIVLVDGGIDSILRRDETSIGAPEEDLASLQAVNGLSVPHRFIMCVGFGAEMRDGIPHAQVLERIAELERADAYLGATSLSRRGEAGRAYLEAPAFVREGQRSQRGTHVHTVVASSMKGVFGSDEPNVWPSPLASMCWFFSLPAVAETHRFARHLEHTESFWDVTAAVRACRKDLKILDRTDIPL